MFVSFSVSYPLPTEVRWSRKSGEKTISVSSIFSTSLSNSQTLYLYAYCGNDPINHTDPDGLFFGKLFKKIGKIFSAVGVAINKILGNIVVQIALTVLAAVVTFGTSLIASLSILMPYMTAPAWLTTASYVLKAVNYASKIATVMEISGILMQGKIKQFAKILGMAFVGAFIGVVEEINTKNCTKKVQNRSLTEIENFAKGLRRDNEAVKNALSENWSNGKVEGQGAIVNTNYVPFLRVEKQ
jgi:hypothetical protein